MTEASNAIKATRRIAAPASIIFSILATPRRHVDIDGSNMLRGTLVDQLITKVGDTFTMQMHRLGDDYLMINHVVEFEPGRRISWQPAPGDTSRAKGNEPANVGIPAGYSWGYTLTPEDGNTTVVTETFDFSALPEDLRRTLRDGGAWIHGSNSVLQSMNDSLELLERISVRQEH
ncbi:SRPBCC family protein [Agrococcus casei]|nr:hypothetical protein [Agrococcus casei]